MTYARWSDLQYTRFELLLSPGPAFGFVFEFSHRSEDFHKGEDFHRFSEDELLSDELSLDTQPRPCMRETQSFLITGFKIAFTTSDGLLDEDYKLLDMMFSDNSILDIEVVWRDKTCKARGKCLLRHFKRRAGISVSYIILRYSGERWPVISGNPYIGFGG